METLRNADGLRAGPPGAPAPFAQPASGLEPQEYLAQGHFAAAVSRTTELIPNTDDAAAVLRLWYVRIQSLLFLQLGHQAADETHACLGPLEKNEFLDALPDGAARLAAWKLRLILVPVRTKGINQAAVQLYFTLGADARAEAAEAAAAAETAAEADGDSAAAVAAAAPWLDALQLAGLYTVSALIAMRDYLTALHLLTTQYAATQEPETAQLLALTYIYVGDTLSARAWVARLPDSPEAAELKALYTFADSDSSENILPVVSEVYSGRVGDAVARLEEQLTTQAGAGLVLNACITNLFTLYDLCYPDARERRARLADRLVAAGNTYMEDTDLVGEFRRSIGSA